MFYRIMSVMLLLLVAACSAQTSVGVSSGSVATSCDACHHRARCVHDNRVHDNSVETVAVSCRCDDGWVGDGFTCYDPTSCNQGCCSQGYRWSALQGCVDIDECSLPQTPCAPGERCQNTKGSFSCLVDLPQRSAARNRSMRFSCYGPCPAGQDCIIVWDVIQCADPCDHYTPLNHAWRATDVEGKSGSYKCDENISYGYYRMFLGNSSVQMPERCIDYDTCGTQVPLWLKTPHPLLSEGIILAEVCGSHVADCCSYKSDPIKVKACPGNYYVYKFTNPSQCPAAYCADVNTMVCDNCNAGQDCVLVDGTSRCIDPCDHYTPLNDAWRATDVGAIEGSQHCDQVPHWQGWYRMFLGNSSVQMSERCIESNMCGTGAPLWLQTPHPLLSEGIIKAEVCGSYTEGCCHIKENPIKVKACPKNYYVYKFTSPSLCHRAYCADVKTLVCNNCTAAQTCVSEDKINWRCEEKLSYLEPELVCGRDQLRLTVGKNFLEDLGLDGSSAHLIDPRCHEQVDGPETMSYLVERRRDVCGNVVKNNGTHLTYSNIVFVYPPGLTKESIHVPRSFQFSCIFPLDDITSLDTAISYQPLASGEGVVSSGDPTRASMTLYTRPDFSEAFPAGPVRLPLGSALHVGVSVNNTEYDGFGLLLETCYVTNSPNASDAHRHFLIQNRCPVDRRHVKVIESGASRRARFSALFFLYQGTYEDVYLHCRISMCDRSSGPCSPNCSRRRARSAASSYQLPVAVGPISWF